MPVTDYNDMFGHAIERIAVDKQDLSTKSNKTEPLLTCLAQSWPQIDSDDLLQWVP